MVQMDWGMSRSINKKVTHSSQLKLSSTLMPFSSVRPLLVRRSMNCFLKKVPIVSAVIDYFYKPYVMKMSHPQWYWRCVQLKLNENWFRLASSLSSILSVPWLTRKWAMQMVVFKVLFHCICVTSIKQPMKKLKLNWEHFGFVEIYKRQRNNWAFAHKPWETEWYTSKANSSGGGGEIHNIKLNGAFRTQHWCNSCWHKHEPLF